MQKIYLIGFILSLIGGFAQAQSLTGRLLSAEDNSPIEGSHILNLTQGEMTTSSALGIFTLEAVSGDTLVISNINFNTKQFIVNEKRQVEIRLNPAQIQLKEVIVNNLPPTEQAFRKKLVDMEMQEDPNFLPFGMIPAKPKGKVPELYNRETKLAFGSTATGPGIGLPISFFTKKFSKRHKAERNYYETAASQPNTIVNNHKYNRDLVAELTGLEGDKLTAFMSSLDLDTEYITNATEYEIAARIVKEFKNYTD